MGAKGGLELRSRQDLQQPQGLAAVSRAEWQVAPNQHIQGPERLGLVPLLGEGGSRAKEQAPDSQWPTQGGRSRATESEGGARSSRQGEETSAAGTAGLVAPAPEEGSGPGEAGCHQGCGPGPPALEPLGEESRKTSAFSGEQWWPLS